MHFLALFILTIFPLVSFARCPEYNRIHGQIDLAKNTWKTLHVDKSKTESCGDLPVPENPNLAITVTRGKATFSTQIFQSTDGYFDYLTEDGTLSGGAYPLTNLSLDTFVPTWFRGAKLRITEISTGKLIIETKL